MAETEQDDAIVPPKNNTMMMVIIAINLIAVLGIGGFLAFGNSSADESGNTTTPAIEVDPGAPPTLVPLDPFIVNLKEPGGTRYLKMVIEVEVPGDKGGTHLKTRIAPVRHQIISTLSELTFADTQGSEKKSTIRKGLVKRINEALKGDIAKDVYFTEFVIQ